MNGRVYDPVLGRFLSADPFIQAPNNSQSYNRYSYVFNNPLSHTDPSGYFSLTNVVRAGLKYNMVTGWAYTRPVRTYFQRHENARTAGAIGAGAADYYIGGGTPVFSSAYAWYIADITGGDPWEAAVVAGATSYASAGVGGSGWAWYTKVFWYGVIGGTVSKHYGGEFEQGFKAAAAGSAVGMGLNARGAYPAISASVAGGVSAELGGGKFKNGAAQGAFAYAVSGMFAEGGSPGVESDRRGTWDSVTDERISMLDPAFQNNAIEFINNVESELGIKLRVTDGYRTIEQQDGLYWVGRSGPDDYRPIRTNAMGGESLHNYGLAIDVVEISGGRVNYSTNWGAIGRIGESMGMDWGGRWTSPVDRPHFESRNQYPLTLR